VLILEIANVKGKIEEKISYKYCLTSQLSKSYIQYTVNYRDHSSG